MRTRGEEVAAVIVEPVAGNMGVIPPAAGFLQSLRTETEKYGALLIFDEVITGFRVAYRSAQGLYGIIPDLTVMGKVIGGGLPVGAYGGKRQIMEKVAPVGPVYQAGTLSGNPLAMAAGIATLQSLTPEVYEELEQKAARLAIGFEQNARESGVSIQINRVGSLLGVFFNDQPVRDYESSQASSGEQFRLYYDEMLRQGILLAPSPFETMFVSVAHTEEQIERTIAANRQALAKVAFHA